jgi:predicted N-acetyltransferase YhbS
VIGSVSGSGVQHGAGYQVQGQGIARLRVDASFGAVRIGDLLTSSPTPGHAMLARAPLPGTVIAKALEPLERDAGVIRVMIMPR